MPFSPSAIDRCARLALATAVALALGSAAQPGGAQTLETVRVAAFPLDATGNVFYAYDLGLFKKAGLDVQFVTVTSGAVVGQAVASGTIDIGTTNVVSIALAHQSGIPFVIIAPSGASSAASPLEAIVVAKDSPFKTAKDLEGKTAVTTVLQGILQTEADAWMDKNGGDPKTVKWIEGPIRSEASMVEAGRVDFAAITEPFVTAALDDGNSRILGYIGPEVSRLLVEGGFFCTADYAKMHPDAVKKFRSALMDAGRWANAHQADANAILLKYTKGTPTPDAHRAVFLNTFKPADIQPLIDATAKYGGLKASFPAGDFVLAN
jgi:NitT/TauT family transport system substrate-binding protein